MWLLWMRTAAHTQSPRGPPDLTETITSKGFICLINYILKHNSLGS